MAVDADPTVTANEGVNINIRCSNGNKFSVKTNLESSVSEFKTLLAQNCDVSPEQQRLIYKGRILKDEQTLDSYGLQADHTVHMVRGFAPVPSASSTPANVVNASNSSAVAQGGVLNSGGTGLAGAGADAGTGAPLFPGLGLGALGGTGAPGLFGAGFPEFEQVQQQLTQNPNMMRDLMSLPAVQNLVNNPEIMRSMIMSNPQMREIIDRNPELGHILNDPGTLRQTLEAARNPELMREMMRNTDRAMSNIESSPEGFNALRRMYENVQEPLMNATTMAGSGAAADSGSNPFAALLGNQGGNQTRDVPNSAPAGTETTSGTAVPNASPLPNPWNNNGTQTNSVTRTNPIGGARPPSIAGLGGLGLPDMGTLDPSLYSQLLQTPAMSQTLQSLLSNPQYMEQMVSRNPQLQALLDVNPQFRVMMQNPDFLRQLASPESMQQMMAVMQQLSQLGRQQSTPEGGAQTAQNNENPMNLNFLMDLFGGRGAGAGGINASSNPNVPPEELYATQLSQLQEMGFFDTQENIRALRATSGNVNAAVERLLNNPGL